MDRYTGGLWLQCLRPAGHKGPHLIQRSSGEYIAWQYDEQCVCQDCLSEDDHDHCIRYDLMDSEEAKILIESSTQTGPSENVDRYFLGRVARSEEDCCG